MGYLETNNWNQRPFSGVDWHPRLPVVDTSMQKLTPQQIEELITRPHAPKRDFLEQHFSEHYVSHFAPLRMDARSEYSHILRQYADALRPIQSRSAECLDERPQVGQKDLRPSKAGGSGPGNLALNILLGHDRASAWMSMRAYLQLQKSTVKVHGDTEHGEEGCAFLTNMAQILCAASQNLREINPHMENIVAKSPHILQETPTVEQFHGLYNQTLHPHEKKPYTFTSNHKFGQANVLFIASMEGYTIDRTALFETMPTFVVSFGKLWSSEAYADWVRVNTPIFKREQRHVPTIDEWRQIGVELQLATFEQFQKLTLGLGNLYVL